MGSSAAGPGRAGAIDAQAPPAGAAAQPVVPSAVPSVVPSAVPEAAEDAAGEEDVLHIACCDALLAAATDAPVYALCGVDCREQRIHLDLPSDAEVCPLCAERARGAAARAEETGVSACDLVCPDRTFGRWDAGE